MDQTRSTSRYILVALCIVVVFTALVLVALNAWTKQTGVTLPFSDRYEEGYAKGYNDARDRLRAAGMLLVPPESIYMTGTVVSVGKDSLVVRQTSLDTDPVVDNVPDERNIAITSSTKVYLQTEKDPGALAKELSAFEQKSRTDPTALPPDSTVNTEIKVSDIPVGATVTVRSATDLRLLKDITAMTVVYRK